MTVHENVHTMLSHDDLTDEGARHLARCKECRAWQGELSRIRLDAPQLFGNDVPWIGDATDWRPAGFAPGRPGVESAPARRRVTQIAIAAALVAAIAIAVLVIPRDSKKPEGFAGGGSAQGAHFSLTTTSKRGNDIAQSMSFSGTVIFGQAFSGAFHLRGNGTEAEGRVIVVDGRGWVSSPDFENGTTFATAAYKAYKGRGLLETLAEYPPAIQDHALMKVGEETLNGESVEHWRIAREESMGEGGKAKIDADAWVGTTDHIARRKTITTRIPLQGSVYSSVSDLALTDIGDVPAIRPPDGSAKTIDAQELNRRMDAAEGAEMRSLFVMSFGLALVDPKSSAVTSVSGTGASGSSRTTSPPG